MTISELLQGKTPNPDFEGWVTNDDYVFAIDITGKSEVNDYVVVQMGIEGLDAQLNPITQDKTYIRAGQSTMKTGNQRSFSMSGDRYIGDAAQDFILSHNIKYGTGSNTVVKYVYFNILTGKGEMGQATIIVNSDGSGNAGESSAIDVEFKKSGSAPEEYTYSAE